MVSVPYCLFSLVGSFWALMGICIERGGEKRGEMSVHGKGLELWSTTGILWPDGDQVFHMSHSVGSSDVIPNFDSRKVLMCCSRAAIDSCLGGFLNLRQKPLEQDSEWIQNLSLSFTWPTSGTRESLWPPYSSKIKECRSIPTWPPPLSLVSLSYRDHVSGSSEWSQTWGKEVGIASSYSQAQRLFLF